MACQAQRILSEWLQGIVLRAIDLQKGLSCWGVHGMYGVACHAELPDCSL